MTAAAKLLPPALGIISLLLIVLFGACITGLVLKEPDICFLLAGGRWIAEHGQIPLTDPFAYNISRDYIVEQWLTELIFYWLWQYSGSIGLLCFDAFILTLTFITMPYRLMRLNRIPAGRALMATTLIAAGAFVHISVRPEIFSVLFVAIYWEIIKHLEIKAEEEPSRLQWWAIISLAVIMALWTNLHILFVGGLMLLMLYCACSLYCHRRDHRRSWTAPLALICSSLATLVNPYGINLWLSLPGLMTWPKTNEVKPLSLENFHDPCCYSFFILILWACWDLLRIWKSEPNRRHNLSAGQLFRQLMLPAGMAVGARALRAIPMANIMLATALQPDNSRRSEGPVNAALAKFFDPLFWQILCLGCGMLGAGLMTRIIPPEFPQGSAAFNPPCEAVRFIAKAPPAGNLLNDPHFGNVMMWQMKVDRNFPRLFIDSRYHLFKDAILDDYWTMVLCREGWQEKLNEYKIRWIFVPTKLPIVETLSHDPNWHTIYGDATASVLVREAGGN